MTCMALADRTGGEFHEDIFEVGGVFGEAEDFDFVCEGFFKQLDLLAFVAIELDCELVAAALAEAGCGLGCEEAGRRIRVSEDFDVNLLGRADASHDRGNVAKGEEVAALDDADAVTEV